MGWLNLRCKNNRKKGLWLLAKSADTYAKYMKEDYANESKYINSLSDDEKEWLQMFLQGYYHRNKQAMLKLKFSTELKRSRYNQHRGAVSEIYNHGRKYTIDTSDEVTGLNRLQVETEGGVLIVFTTTSRKGTIEC